jgi:hypothetical protein
MTTLKSELEWFLPICIAQQTAFQTGQTGTPLYRMERPALVARYRKVLRTLHWIYSTFMTTLGHPWIESEDEDADLPLKYPQFLLDDFIYHGHRVGEAGTPMAELAIDRVCRFHSRYSFFLTVIENRLAEREFDMASWGENAEWRFSASRVLLDLCIT